MAFTVGSVAAKDGAGTTVGGGLIAADIAGAGAGPWFLYHAMIDGVAGVNKAQVTSSNALKVEATNAGTFATQASQSGTWTVQPGNTANTTAWLVTGTGGTFPATQSGTWNVTNISGTVSLPTGAATAAKQPALGTAGVSSADVISVQGIASGTALNVANAGTFATQATQAGTWNITNVSGTVSLPTGAATSALQTSGAAKTQVVDGAGNVIGATANALDVNIKSGS